MACGQVNVLWLLVSSVLVVHGCKSKVGTSDSEQEDFAQEEMCDVENPMFFEQYPELDGEFSVVNFPAMLDLPINIYLSPSWMERFKTESGGIFKSKEVMHFVKELFKHASLDVKMFITFDNSDFIPCEKELNLTNRNLKDLEKYISEPRIGRAAIVYLTDDPTSKLLGTAYPYSICDKNNLKLPRAIVRWNENIRKTAVTMAHEIGHILGVSHDFEKYPEKAKVSERDFTCGPGKDNSLPNNRIMNYNDPESRWSRCSNVDFEAFYNRVTKNDGVFCLKEHTKDLDLAVEWRDGVMYLANNARNSYGDIPVRSYHISCDSDTFDGSSNYIGIVLYQKDGSNSFSINGRNIRPGYIYLVKTSKLSKRSGETLHAAAYEHLFGVPPPRAGLVSSGFSHFNGAFIKKSSTFNYKQNAYTGVLDREMHAEEFEMVKNAIIRWSCNGQQNLVPKRNCRITRSSSNACPIQETELC